MTNSDYLFKAVIKKVSEKVNELLIEKFEEAANIVEPPKFETTFSALIMTDELTSDLPTTSQRDINHNLHMRVQRLENLVTMLMQQKNDEIEVMRAQKHDSEIEVLRTFPTKG